MTRYDDDPSKMDEGEAVALHTPLVKQRARRFYPKAKACYDGSVEFEEIVSYGMEGLLCAIRQFDASRGLRFSTFAYPSIDGYINKRLDQMRRFGHKSIGRAQAKRRTWVASQLTARPDEDSFDRLTCFSTTDAPLNDDAPHAAALLATLPPDEATVMRLRYSGLSRLATARTLAVPLRHVVEVEGRAVLRLAGDDPATLFVGAAR